MTWLTRWKEWVSVSLVCFWNNSFKGSDTKYPLAMFLVAVGFFIVAIVEIAVNQCHGHGHSHGDNVEGDFNWVFDWNSSIDELWATTHWARFKYDTIFGVPRLAVQIRRYLNALIDYSAVVWSKKDFVSESTQLFEDAQSSIAIYTMVFGLSGRINNCIYQSNYGY